MSKAVLFYDVLLKFIDACSVYQMHNSLYDDLLNGNPPSPESYKVLVNNHEGDLDVLRDKVNNAKTKRLKMWWTLRRMMEAEKVYDSADAEFFFAKLMERNEDCDFRKKVRSWSRAEKSKIAGKKKGAEPDTVRGFKWYIDKYADLTLRREKRNK